MGESAPDDASTDLRPAVYTQCMGLNGSADLNQAWLRQIFDHQYEILSRAPFPASRVARWIESLYTGEQILEVRLARTDLVHLDRTYLFMPAERRPRFEPPEAFAYGFRGTVNLVLRRTDDEPPERVSHTFANPLWTCEDTLQRRPTLRVLLGSGTLPD